MNKLTTESHAEQNSVTADLEIAAEGFGRSMQGRLFIVRPGLLTSGGEFVFKARPRSAPVKLDADSRHDTIRVKIPAGFKVDELPAPAKIQSGYGSLTTNWSLRDGEIVMERSLEIHETVAPASEYAQVRDFFEKAAGAETAPVVLVKE